MRILRWVVLIADVIMLLGFVTAAVFVWPAGVAAVVGVMMWIVLLLANIIVIAITWRREGKGFGKITGVFD